ncbi:UV DNA damage repair endonuclease UvsE [Aerococcaceae bacterium WGS1372]
MNQDVRIGYACLNPDISQGFKTCRFDNLTNDKWIELIEWNLATLEEMITYTVDRGIGLLRLSSDLIPFATKFKEGVDLDWKKHFESTFNRLKEKVQSAQLRISMHPGQYTVLNSMNMTVVQRAIDDLEYHAELLELLGGNQTNKIIIHIGGIYGDKEAAMARFIQQANQLSERVRSHLVIENDERLYSIQDVLTMSEQTGLPVIFDNLHHEVRLPLDDTPLCDYIQASGRTWKPADGRQKIHYSQQAAGKKAGAHSETIAIRPFIGFLEQLPANQPIDIMLEVKDKNRSAEKIQIYLDQDIVAAEKLWAKRKYAVLAKSASIYQKIRNVLKIKQDTDFVLLIELLEKTESMLEDKGAEVNAAQHIWGYFKKQATHKEEVNYQKVLAQYQAGEITVRQLRQFFKRLLKKYPNDYLQASLYFNE